MKKISITPKAIVFINLFLTLFATYAFTKFTSPKEILSANSWGAGTPSATYITAFATMRPWWWQYEPEPVRLTSAGGIEPIVKIPREQIIERTTKKHKKYQVLPVRGIGYEAVLGFLTMVRSIGSSDLIYDFRLFVYVQQILLVLSLSSVPIFLYYLHPQFSSHKTFVYFNLIYLLLLIIRSNKNEFLTEGIIDSSLANVGAVLSVGAFFFITKNLDIKSAKQVVLVIALSMFLSFWSQVRGEFLIVHLFVYLFICATSLKRPRRLLGLLLSVIFLFSCPISYGLINKSLFGKFIPLRLLYGQNLYEPIGQYPNPWGIEYRDEWIWKYLKENNLKSTSFLDDEFLTKRYFECFYEKPGLFFLNFISRLKFFSSKFCSWINVITIPLILVGLVWISYKDEVFQYIAQPLVFAIGYLLYFGWINYLVRCVTPVHFLINIFLCCISVYLLHSKKSIESIYHQNIGFLSKYWEVKVINKN